MFKFKKIALLSIISMLFTQCKKDDPITPVETLTKVELGKLIFFDNTLSNPGGQSCGTCHNSEVAFSDPFHSVVSPGIFDGLFGNRNAPMVSYSMFIPPLRYDNVDETHIGGLFWDGRVNSLEEQAKKPFFNPLEMNITDLDMFAEKVKASSFYGSFSKIYGETSDPNVLLDNVVDAIATFERSAEVNPFSSKFDYYLKGQASLTSLEKLGLDLFTDTLKAKCALCHIIEPDPASGKVLFTDFTYDNIGIPRNKFNPFYGIPKKHNPDGAAYVDLGLGFTTKSTDNNGQFRVPSLRNVAITAPYFHNGAFSSLEEAVHFYNKRDVEPMAPPEVADHVNKDELGDLKLTEAEETAVVAFLKTLTDGYK